MVFCLISICLVNNLQIECRISYARINQFPTISNNCSRIRDISGIATSAVRLLIWVSVVFVILIGLGIAKNLIYSIGLKTV